MVLLDGGGNKPAKCIPLWHWPCIIILLCYGGDDGPFGQFIVNVHMLMLLFFDVAIFTY